MEESESNKNKISIFLSTEINEIYSKSTIKELYTSPEKPTNLKIIIFIYKNNILKNFKISIGNEFIISNENNNNQIIENNNISNYIIEYNNDYYFTINLGIIQPNTNIDINTIYLSYNQNEGNKYISNLFKRYPIILIKEEENKNYNFIKYEKIEGEIFLKTQNKIEIFNLNIINFNEDIINKENDEENNFIKEGKIFLNTLNKQYNTTKELYIKYQLKGIENIKEYKIYQFPNDFIPLIRLVFITSSLSIRKNQSTMNNNNQKIFLFNQKLNEKDNKSINVLHYNYLFENNKNNIINDNNNEIIYPNKYLFVIDESLNMAGEKIAKIRGALKLLLYSLNNNCEYQIIGFNDTIKLYDGAFKYAIKSNIIKSLEYISNIFVENKKCNLFAIIKLIYYLCNKNKNIPINIFLFTNAICDKIEINKSLNIIYENSSQKNFHLNIFSLGEKYNKYFIVSGSILGNGNYYFINKLKELNKEVISELTNCYKKYYSNINAEINKSIIITKFKHQNISQISAFENNPLNLFFISKYIESEENEKEKEKIKIKLFYKKYFNGKFLLQNIILEYINIINLSFGDELFILYLYNIFSENKNSFNKEITPENKNSNIDDFSTFLKNNSTYYDMNLENINEIYYYGKDNIKCSIKKIFNCLNKQNKYNIEKYINQNNESKDYYDIFPLIEKKYHDFLLIDETQNNSELSERVKSFNEIKKPRKKSYGKMMIGGIFGGLGKMGNSLAVLGKNIGNTISIKKEKKIKNKENINNIREIKSQNITIKKAQREENVNDNEEDLEDNHIIDNYLGNKYGYEKKEEFLMNAVFSQDLEGFWDYNNKKIEKIKEKYKEMNDIFETYLKENNILKNKKNNQIVELSNEQKNVVVTFIMIIALMRDYKDKLDEFTFLIYKGRNFMKRCGYEFNSIVKEFGLILE